MRHAVAEEIAVRQWAKLTKLPKHSSLDFPLFMIPIESEQDLEKVLQDSFESRQFILKHSTRCSISLMMKSRLERAHPDVEIHILDLLNHRDISNKIAEHFQVQHESPQMLVIQDGECKAHASHTSISELNLN